jgi:HAMP domain-containing protein/predicted Ser/Thr protein kinase
MFLGTALVVAAVLALALALTSRSATETARDAIQRGLEITRDRVQASLEARDDNLLSKAGVFVQSTPFIALVDSRIPGDALDQSIEAAGQLEADWVQITDAQGVRLAKSDEPGAPADDLSQTGLVGRALGGEAIAGYGSIDDAVLFQAVAMPITRPATRGTPPTVVGTLMATKSVDPEFVNEIRESTGGTTHIVVYLLDTLNVPHLAASTIPRSAELDATLAAWNPDDTTQGPNESHAELQLGGEHYVRLGAALLSANGDPIGGFLALRSRDAELAPFRALQRTILIAGGAGLVVAFLLTFLLARQITKPVAALVGATRKAADGDYRAEIKVTSRDEIGTLAQAFSTLLSDLRDKQALVEFLQGDSGGRTVPMQAAGVTLQAAATAQGIVPGATIAKRYHIKEALGTGGMGTVFRAHDAELDEVVAIKTLRPEILSQDPTALERFKGEIRLARRISHRNVVRTHDLGEINGVYFISMEYVEGKSLKELIRARGRLPAATTLTVAKQLLRALEVAHEQGVIHRDVKPQNVAVTPDGVLKVMDFGIARLAKRTQGVTQAGMVVGTPEYMAPEQLLGDDVDARADLYSAGVVLYECLTGQLPFNADSPITLITKVLEEVPASPRSISPDIPASLADLVVRALDKDPNKRPQTATAFHDLLDAIG